MRGGSKTQAMRLLEAQRIPYEEVGFPEAIDDALGVAAHAGLPPGEVFKTLVVIPEPTSRPALVLIPADSTLDLKRLARDLGAKRVEMARQEQAERLTGLKVGGISPLALTHRRWPVYLDRRARSLQTIVVSAGARGRDVRLGVEALVRLTGARWVDAAEPLSAGDPR